MASFAIRSNRVKDKERQFDVLKPIVQ
jgi:hypothetical protein